jgi:hypothetical protein
LKNKTIYICRCCEKKFASHEFAKSHLLHSYQIGTEEADIIKHIEFIDQMKENVDVDELMNKFIYSVSLRDLKNMVKSMTSNRKKTVIVLVTHSYMFLQEIVCLKVYVTI